MPDKKPEEPTIPTISMRGVKATAGLGVKENRNQTLYELSLKARETAPEDIFVPIISPNFKRDDLIYYDQATQEITPTESKTTLKMYRSPEGLLIPMPQAQAGHTPAIWDARTFDDYYAQYEAMGQIWSPPETPYTEWIEPETVAQRFMKGQGRQPELTTGDTYYYFKGAGNYDAYISLQNKYASALNSNDQEGADKLQRDIQLFLQDNAVPYTPQKMGWLTQAGRGRSELEQVPLELIGAGRRPSSELLASAMGGFGKGNALQFIGGLTQTAQKIGEFIMPAPSEEFEGESVVDKWNRIVGDDASIKAFADTLGGSIDETIGLINSSIQYAKDNGDTKGILSHMISYISQRPEAFLSPVPFASLDSFIGEGSLEKVAKSYGKMIEEAISPATDGSKVSDANFVDAIFSPEKTFQAEQETYIKLAADLDAALVHRNLGIQNGDSEEMRRAFHGLVNAYKYADENLPRAPFVSGTSLMDEKVQQNIYEAVAQIHLQTGMLPERSQIKDIVERLSDPGIELAWSLVVDAGNILDIVPLGKGLSKVASYLPEGNSIAKYLKSIPNLEQMDIKGVPISMIRKEANAVLGKVIDDGFMYYKMGKYATIPGTDIKVPKLLHPIFELDSLFRLSTNAIASRLGVHAYNYAFSSFGAKYHVSSTDVNKAAKIFNVYGTYIGEAIKKGMTTSEIIDDVWSKVRGSADIDISKTTKHQVEFLVEMARAINPNDKSWDKVMRSAFRTVEDEIVEAEVKRLNQVYAEDKSKILSNTTLTLDEQNEALKLLNEQMVKEARAEIPKKMTSDRVAAKVGDAFQASFKDANRAWAYSNIMKDTVLGKLLGGNLGENYPRLRQFIDSTNRAYLIIKGALIDNWLFRAVPRFWIQQLQENFVTFIAQHPDGTWAGIADGLDMNNYLKGVDFNPALHMAELRTNLHFGVDSSVEEYLKNSSKATKGGFFGSFNESYNNSKLSWVQNRLAKGIPIKTGLKGKLEMLLPSIPMMLKAWRDGGASLPSALETSYRTKLSWRFYENNMMKVSPIVLSRNIDNMTTLLTKAGVDADTIGAMSSRMSSAWQRANGNASEFIRLMDIEGIAKGKARRSFGIPASVLNKMDADDRYAIYAINELFNAYATASKGKLTGTRVDEFFNNIRSVIQKASEEGHNKEGIAGVTILRNGSTPVSANISKLLDEYEQGKFNVSLFNKIIDEDAETLKSLGITDTSLIHHKQTIKQLHEIVRPNRKLPKTWDELADAVDVRQYPRDAVDAMHLDKYKTLPEEVQSLGDTGDLEAVVDNILNNTTDKLGRPLTLEAKQALKTSLLDPAMAEYNQAGAALRFQSGTLWDKIDGIYEADSVLGRDLRTAVSAVVDVQNKVAGAAGWLFLYEPGISIWRGKLQAGLHGFNPREGWNVVFQAKTNMFKNVAEYFKEINDVLTTGGKIYNPSKGELWSRFGGFDNFKFDPDNGKLLSAEFVHPDGLRTFMSADNNAMLFTHFKKMTGIEIAADANAPAFTIITDSAFVKPNPFTMDIPAEARPPIKTAIPKETVSLKPFFDTYIDAEQFGTFTLRHWLNQILARPLKKANKILDELQPEEAIKMLDDLADETRKAGSAYRADAILEIRHRIAYQLEYTESLTDPQIIKPPPIALHQYPEEIHTWILYNTQLAAKYENMMSILDEWNAALKGEVDASTTIKYPKKASIQPLTDIVNNAAKDMEDMYDKVMYGGNVADYELEGAIPHMNLVMKDYTTSTTVLDQYMKNIYWFWMFPTRGAAAWLRMVADKPQVLSYYNKYLRYSRMSAYQAGAINSKGDVLPSMVGYVPIMGSNMWINSLSGMPILNYAFTPREESAYKEEDDGKDPIWRTVDNILYQTGLRGLRAGPTFELLMLGLRGSDYRDPYSGFGLPETLGSTLVETIPVPKIFQDIAVDFIFRKHSNPSNPSIWNPMAAFSDSLIERQMLEDLLSELRTASSEDERQRIIQPYMGFYDRDTGELKYGVFTDPEQNRAAYDIWNRAAEQVGDTNLYAKNLVGWVTSFYPRYFTSDDLEINQVRNEINFLREAINDVTGLPVFMPDLSQKHAYNLYNDSRFDAPESWVWQLRNASSFVKDPITGEAVEDTMERRKEMARGLTVQLATDEYYNRLESATKKRDDALRLFPINSSSRDPAIQKIWDEWWDTRLAIEADPQYTQADRPWVISYKPTEVIYDFWRNIFWNLMEDTRPIKDYDNNETEDEYAVRLKQWERDMPVIAEKLIGSLTPNIASALAANLPGTEGRVDTRFAEEGQDLSQILPSLLKEASTPEGFENWKLSTDSLIEAVAHVNDVLYMDKYKKAGDGLSTMQAKQATSAFLKNNPPPTIEQLVDGVSTMYPNRWTPQEIKRMLTTPDGEPREVLGAEESFESGRSELESNYQEAWDIWNWLPPNRRNEFRSAIKSFGGDVDNLEYFFVALGADSLKGFKPFRKPEDFKAFLDIMRQAANKMGIDEPAGDELAVRAEAERLNDDLVELINRQFGATFMEDVYYPYLDLTSSERKAYRKSNPEEYQQIQQYLNFRDQYAKQYPLWTEYYYNKSSGGAYYSGGRRYGGGGGGSRGFVNQGGGQFVGMGMRSTQDVQELLSGKKALGSGGVPKWYPAGASPVLANKLAEGAPLNTTDIKYLKQLAETHPELADEIAPIVG